MQEPEVAAALLAARDVWDDLSSVALLNPDRQRPILTALLEQLIGGEEAAVVNRVREFYAAVLNPTRLQIFVVGPNDHQTAVPSHRSSSQLLASLVSQEYSGRPFPPSFAAMFSRAGVRSCMAGDGGVSQLRGCPVMSMAATDRQAVFTFYILVCCRNFVCSAYLTSFCDGTFPTKASQTFAASMYNITLSQGPVGYDVDCIAAVSVAISALTMMEGRYASLW
jgi:hypothetical protein